MLSLSASITTERALASGAHVAEEGILTLRTHRRSVTSREHQQLVRLRIGPDGTAKHLRVLLVFRVAAQRVAVVLKSVR